MVKSYASLAFSNGPGIKFRIDPSEIAWSFKINSTVIPTVGGRVVQVTGATLSDMTITGDFGQKRPDSSDRSEMESWQLAVEFAKSIYAMMQFQSKDSTSQGKMHATAVFSYPPLDWTFNVYIKAFTDPDGGAIRIRPGKFSHSYRLTLFVVQSGSAKVLTAGDTDGIINNAKAAAINQYIARLSDGVGWQPTSYDGNWKNYYQGQYDTTQQTPDALVDQAGGE